MTCEDPPWLRLARLELGTREIAGLKSNARIDQYHSYTRAGVPGVDADSVPWDGSGFCQISLSLLSAIELALSQAERGKEP